MDPRLLIALIILCTMTVFFAVLGMALAKQAAREDAEDADAAHGDVPHVPAGLRGDFHAARVAARGQRDHG